MLKVAVGVITNKAGEILISQRSVDAHQGGLWEFPGGKFAEGESAQQALKRELLEELGIIVISAKPMLTIEHDYGDLSVHLDVHRVDVFQGETRGAEKQQIKWLAASELNKYAFPAANKKIIDTLSLPQHYPIVDELLGDADVMLKQLSSLISRGYKLIQLRAKSFEDEEFETLAKVALKQCESSGVLLFLNTRLEVALSLNASAVHLSFNEFCSSPLPFPDDLSTAVSCHSQYELSAAQKAGALFTVLSPVSATQSHPNVKPLGWQRFAEIVNNNASPVYALGGVGPADLRKARSSGAYGVSGIRGFSRE
ncbi:MAG: DNA mismatch repair protein MutT [Cycloclasticus sp. symbiont of Poecilosclerida sp. N]|nr:MAG: DNA mismatch repair protein MutT [Cycloclasticus sp. symbiont of Poecilosclerida sp. N]